MNRRVTSGSPVEPSTMTILIRKGMRMWCLLVVVPYETQPYATQVMVNAAISDLSATGVCLSSPPSPLFSLNAFPHRKSAF